jgi:predicted nucleic acid-binding protein
VSAAWRAGRVVLDANVLHALPLRDTLLTLAFPPHDLFEPCWSEEILAEVERSLSRRIGAAPACRAARAMRTAFPYATADVPPALSARMPNHTKDRHVLATAVATGARLLVTSNLRDFAGAADLGVAVQHPDAFLCSLLDLDANEVRAGLDRQASLLRRPASTRADVLALLARAGLPEFARRAR